MDVPPGVLATADQIYAELMDSMQSSADGPLDPATFHRRFQEKLEAALGQGR